MTTAFVLPGGASLGSIQVGMAEVLIGAGIEPDLIVGTSVGALNGAWLASHLGPAGVNELRDVWLSVRRRDIFPFSPIQCLLGLSGRRDSFVSSAALARWLAVRAPFYQLEQALIPLHLMATDVQTGEPVMLSTGDVIDSLLASTAIPGVYPPVELHGRLLFDGGIAANTAISQAVALGADTVYVLPTAGSQPVSRPRTAAAVGFIAVAHLLGHASHSEVMLNAGRCTLYVVPPPPAAGVSPFDFRHSRELMDAAAASARAWMTEPVPVAALEH